MFGSGTQLDHTVRVFDTPFVGYLRDVTGNPDVMEFLIPADNRMAVGIWLDRLGGRVAEIGAYDRSDGPGRDLVAQVRWYLSPGRRKANETWKHNLRFNRRAWFRRKDDIHRRKDDVMGYLKRRMGPMHNDHPKLAII